MNTEQPTQPAVVLSAARLNPLPCPFFALERHSAMNLAIEPEHEIKTAWSHLPNAQHIDRVLIHLREHPERWTAAWTAAWAAASAAARNAARAAARDAARNAAWDAAWDAARDAAQNAARNAAWATAWTAITALITYDDCTYILELPSGAVRVMASAGSAQAVLLYPAVVAMNGNSI